MSKNKYDLSLFLRGISIKKTDTHSWQLFFAPTGKISATFSSVTTFHKVSLRAANQASWEHAAARVIRSLPDASVHPLTSPTPKPAHIYGGEGEWGPKQKAHPRSPNSRPKGNVFTDSWMCGHHSSGSETRRQNDRPTFYDRNRKKTKPATYSLCHLLHF